VSRPARQPARPPGHPPMGGPGRGLWVGLAVGAPVTVFGVVGLIDQAGIERSLATLRWEVGLLVVHDALLVPCVLALVWAASHVLPRPVHAPVVAGLLGSALVVAIALPGVRGLGNPSGNPTVHPFDTTAALAWALAALWGVVLMWAVAGAVSARRKPPAPHRVPGPAAPPSR